MPRLTDYLIFKRALVLSGGANSHVAGGTRSEPYQDALAQWTLSGRAEDAAKYVNPFESVQAKTGGYRGKKYASNGPDNTWSGWQSGLDPTPVVHVKGTANPKEYSFDEIPAADLESQFLSAETAGDTAKRPRLIDLAIWWFRSRDLEALDISEDAEPQALVDALLAEAGLTTREISTLFDTSDTTLSVS